MAKVLAILKHSNETLGAKIEVNGKIYKCTTKKLKALRRRGMQFSNTTFYSNGVVRAKQGNLPVELIAKDEELDNDIGFMLSNRYAEIPRNNVYTGNESIEHTEKDEATQFAIMRATGLYKGYLAGTRKK